MNELASAPELDDYYLVMQMLQTVDIGLVILNKNYEVELWNGFMENHSGITSDKALGQPLFSLHSQLPQAWLERKIQAVFQLASPAYSTWEERPYLFPFSSYRPLSGASELMFQNLTFMPLLNPQRQVQKVCLVIYDVTETANRKIQLEAANKKLEKLSRTDRLTKLLNRGFWEECLEHEFKRNLRASQNRQVETSLIIFDIDHFKSVNDTHGHLAGDTVIQQVAGLLKQHSRETDFAGRYGGEEFVLLMPNTKQENAFQFAERLRLLIAETLIAHEDLELQITVSLGVSSFQPKLASTKAWLENADKALYQAKQQGRNQTCVWQQ